MSIASPILPPERHFLNLLQFIIEPESLLRVCNTQCREILNWVLRRIEVVMAKGN